MLWFLYFFSGQHFESLHSTYMTFTFGLIMVLIPVECVVIFLLTLYKLKLRHGTTIRRYIRRLRAYYKIEGMLTCIIINIVLNFISKQNMSYDMGLFLFFVISFYLTCYSCKEIIDNN